MPFGFEQLPDWPKRITPGQMFGVQSLGQLVSDLGTVVSSFGSGFQLDASSLGHFRPDLSLPAYAGLVPEDGLAPICNLFDREGGGRQYSQRVTRTYARDFRGSTLTYDDHDGVDFVCPVGTPLVAAAPGIVSLVRSRWLRGGLTLTIDHGGGVATQYTHLSKVVAPVGMKVQRGQLVAWSGASGIDLTTFFPLVPPHVHFMSWVSGHPVDPFLADGEDEASGTWLERNNPTPTEKTEKLLPESKVDSKLMHELASHCSDETIQKEITEARHDDLSLVALLEDSFHHDAGAWPDGVRSQPIRKPSKEKVLLSLPLSGEVYRGSTFAD